MMKKILPVLLIILYSSYGPSVYAASAQEIDIKVDAALERFDSEIQGGKTFLEKAKGFLVFPEVMKAGFGIGGEYGEGALRINEKTVDYYSTAAASIGFQFGAQIKTVVLIFLDSSELEKFRNSDGWEAGVDGSVVLIELGGGKDLNTMNIDDPIVGFILSNKGLMYNLTLEGSKLTKLNK